MHDEIKEALSRPPTLKRLEVKPGYEKLAAVLDMALQQAQSGKGTERHTDGDQPFDKQLTCNLIRSEGHGYPRGQAIKKIDEAKRLDIDAAIRELLGSINYIGSDIIILMEQLSQEQRKVAE